MNFVVGNEWQRCKWVACRWFWESYILWTKMENRFHHQCKHHNRHLQHHHCHHQQHYHHNQSQVEARVELDTRKQLTSRMFFLARCTTIIICIISVIITNIITSTFTITTISMFAIDQFWTFEYHICRCSGRRRVSGDRGWCSPRRCSSTSLPSSSSTILLITFVNAIIITLRCHSASPWRSTSCQTSETSSQP